MTVNDDGTIDWEVTIPPEIDREAAEYIASLDAELEAKRTKEARDL